MINRELLKRSQSWEAAYSVVEMAAHAYLFTANARDMSTADLVEVLYPEAEARGEDGIWERNRVFKALNALATHGLKDCARRGPAKTNRFGSLVRPWLWSAPGDVSVEKVCPTCKRPL